MITYFLMLLPLLILAIKPAILRSRVFVTLVVVYILLIIGTRYEVGGDWFSYEMLLRRSSDLSLPEILRYDPGYTMINRLFSLDANGLVYVNLVCASIVSCCLVLFSLRFRNPGLVLFTAYPYFIVTVAMGYTRQSVAAAIFYIAITIANPRNKIISFALVLLAGSFHSSAILLLPFVTPLCTSGRQLRLVLVAVVPLFIYGLFSTFLGERADSITTHFISSSYQSSGAIARVGMIALCSIVYLVIPGRFRQILPKCNFFRKPFVLFPLFLLLILFALPNNSALIDRIALYFLPIQFIILGNLPYVFRGLTSSVFFVLVIVQSALTLAVWLQFGHFSLFWIPYKSILFG